MEDLLLEFSGPYRCTRDATGHSASYAFYRQSSKVNDCGIYLQAVQLIHGFRVCYVGRAKCFADRLRDEFRAWLTGKDRRSGQSLELDPVKYCQGIRSYEVAPSDHAHLLRLRRELLDCTVVFLAGLPTETPRDVQERIEGAFMRHLKGCAGPIADFLYNKPTGSRLYSGKIKACSDNSLRIDGLENPFTDV